MGFSIVCHRCGHLLYEGRDMIHLYRLRREIDGRCPGCGKQLALKPISINFKVKEGKNSGLQKIF